MAGARVPDELQDVWAAKKDVVVSPDGTKIDFFGAAYLWWRPKHLTLNELKLVTDAFIANLVHIKVTSINVNLCSNLSDKSIKDIARRCPKLRELNVSHCSNLTDMSIKAIAQCCDQLEELNVSGIKDLTDESIKAVAKGCPKLKKLSVLDSSNLTDESIKAIAYCYPELLTEFNVSYSSKLTDEAIKAIAQGCPELRELNVLNCSNLTDESITAVANGCCKLDVLNVYGITNLTDESVKAIAEHCPELKEVNVSWIKNLTNDSITAIAEGCHKLKVLNVAHCYNITDESIKAIAKWCPKLTELNVYGIMNLTDESIKATATGCPDLEELNVLDYYSNLTDESIKMIAKSCPGLRQLNIIASSNLTDEPIKDIAKHCPKLKELNVSRCQNLTDKSIKAIAERCPLLEELNVSRCKNLTDESIKAIAESCPSLRLLDVCSSGLKSIPDDIGNLLPELHWIVIAFCKITKLPKSIVKLKSLQFLYVRDNPLQSPPYEIARQGLDAIKLYFEELQKGWIVSKLLKVVLVGDGEAGKTTLRNALAGRPNPRQEDRTIHVDIEKITLNDDLDINVYDCGGQKEYLATQLPYLTGLALYMVIVEAKYATDEYADALEDKLHRFLVVLQNRIEAAPVVLPIVTKVDTVKDPEGRCQWLKNKIKKWVRDTRKAVCGNVPDSNTDSRQPPALVATVSDSDHFTTIHVPSPALAVSVPDTEDEQAVRDSVKAVRDSIIDLTKRSPPLLRGVGQTVPASYRAVLSLFGAIAEHDTNEDALKALSDGTAHALGETSKLSNYGTYRPRDELKNMWNKYRNDPNGSMKSSEIFDAATRLWEAQGLIFIEAELVVLQPKFITKIVKPFVDHRYNDEKGRERIEADVEEFLSSSSLSTDYYTQLIDAMRFFIASGEFESSDKSLFLSFLWRDTRLDTPHYDQVLYMLTRSGVIFKVERDAGEKGTVFLKMERDAGEKGTVFVVPFRLPQNPDERKLERFWPKSLPFEERELKLRFEPRPGFPTGLTERFVSDVHGLGKALHSWRRGVIVKAYAGYSALAERKDNMLYFAVRFKSYSTEGANAAWKALCDAKQMLAAQCRTRFPRLCCKKLLLCEQCCREGCPIVSFEKFDAEKKRKIFHECGHDFDLIWKAKRDDRAVQYTFNGPVSNPQIVAIAEGNTNYHSKSHEAS